MTVVAVLVDPPREGLVAPRIPETAPVSAAEAVDLYEAMIGDVLAAVADSGGDLLVNYRDGETLPDGAPDGDDPEAAVRALAMDALGDLDDVRFERQVGSTVAARVGNTVTHLLEREEATSAAVVPGPVPLLGRTHVDEAAMKLRRSPVVLGPSSDGRVYYAGFAEPIDFEDALATPAQATLARKAADAGLDVDFLPELGVVETGTDLRSLVATLRARRAADAPVPERTAAVVGDLGLRVVADDGPSLVRD